MRQRGPKPHPDRVLMAQHLAYCRMKAQANFRREPWEFTLDQWIEQWQPLWHQRGRGSLEYCMIRLDYALPWRTDNTAIVTNLSRLRENQQRHIGRQRAWDLIRGLK